MANNMTPDARAVQRRAIAAMTGAGRDTLPEVAAQQQAMLSGLSVRERGDLMVALCEAVTEAAVAGIKLEYPDGSEGKLRSELLLRRYGAEFVASLPAELR